jgi:hypothetical protein
VAVGDVKRIPHFLSAGSPKGLQRLMLLNNIKDGFEYRYFDIAQDKKGKWIAWYYKVIPIQSIAPAGLLPKGEGE